VLSLPEGEEIKKAPTCITANRGFFVICRF